MSPEQAAGESRRVDPASDTYYLEDTLYLLLAGHTPFQGRDVEETLKHVAVGVSISRHETELALE